MNNRVFHIIILTLCVVLIAASYVFTLDEIGVHFYGIKWQIHCFLNWIFGVKSAFFGITRSFTFMAHGQFARAFNFHPLGPILFAFIVFQVPYRLWALMKFPKKIPPTLSKLNKYAIALTIIAIFVNWLVNLYAGILN